MLHVVEFGLKANPVLTEALSSVCCQRVALASITDTTPQNLETALSEQKKNAIVHGEVSAW